jgi:hypothetical protein
MSCFRTFDDLRLLVAVAGSPQNGLGGDEAAVARRL